MRAELPWNVAGIPPEAREAARAAARREGLSVGEWLTRRILRSLSGLDEEMPSLGGFDTRAPSGAGLDSWGLPPSAAARRETEEMMARVGRSEVEANEVWRRIEDQMRGLSRRLDSSERSHSEANRTLSRTTQEINIAAREQSQAFEQLGQNVLILNERLERLERAAHQDGTKEAVRALHQGLSRLADQITATANSSASQVTHLTANLEQIAARVGQVRNEADEAGKALEQRIAEAELRLENRIAANEKATQFNTNALDHALEKLDASANQRATDQVEYQRRHGQTEEGINRLEDAIARLEMRLPDGSLERRLDGIEQSVNGMAQRLDSFDPAARFDDAMRELTHRLETLEKDHSELAARTVEPPPASAFAPAPPAFTPEPPPAFEPPPSAFAAYEPPPVAEAPPPAPHGFSFDIPPEVPPADPFAPATDFGPEFNEIFAPAEPQPQDEPENFLAQARRSARAASEKAESERRSRFAGLRWGKDEAAAESGEPARNRYLIPSLLVVLVALAAAAGLMLMKTQPTRPAPAPQFPAKPAAQGGPTFSVPEPPSGDDTQFVVAPQGNAQDFTTQRSEPVAPRTAQPLEQRDVRSAPVKPVPDTAPAHAAPSGDRVIQLANQGNPTALTILGLRALDGTGGQPVNLPEAVKDLTQAAQKGQAVAQYRLGTLYERGQGVTADPAQAAHWYEMAANQGNRKAMHNLAVAYASGTGGKKNMAEAARWFAKAAGLGLSDSQFNLAVLYERGDGVPQSLLDAYKWYSIAAAAGDQESKQRIAVLQTQLSDSDRAAAAKSAATFHAAPLNRAANVPPEPADLGG